MGLGRWPAATRALIVALGLGLSLGPAAAAAVPEEPGPRRCPPGRCRSSEIVFGCSGDAGTSHLLLEPGGRPAEIEVPAGTVSFSARASSPAAGVQLSLQSRLGRQFGSHTSGRAGMGAADVAYFGAVALEGAVPDALVLRVSVEARAPGDGAAPGRTAFVYAGRAWLTLEYRYDAVRPCAAEAIPPAGCSVYESWKAHKGLLAWSDWARVRGINLSQAWSERLGADSRAWVGLPSWVVLPGGGPVQAWRPSDAVSWLQWRDFWTTAAGFASDDWQHVFCYLDADRDLRISRAELGRAPGLFPYERGQGEVCPAGGSHAQDPTFFSVQDRQECGHIAEAFCEGGLKSAGSWEWEPPGCFALDGANGSSCKVLFNAREDPVPRPPITDLRCM